MDEIILRMFSCKLKRIDIIGLFYVSRLFEDVWNLPSELSGNKRDADVCINANKATKFFAIM